MRRARAKKNVTSTPHATRESFLCPAAMLAARNRLLASKSRSFREEEEDDMIFEHAPSGKVTTFLAFNAFR